MTAYLLDVNVLVAMSWPAHSAHSQVKRWFAHRTRIEWATCPFTEAGFVRILSNPAFSRDALSVQDAMLVLSRNLSSPGHRFWADDVGFAEATRPLHDQLVGHQQVTDAYLLGLALRKKGKLLTLDRGVLDLLASNSTHRDAVDLID